MAADEVIPETEMPAGVAHVAAAEVVKVAAGDNALDKELEQTVCT